MVQPTEREGHCAESDLEVQMRICIGEARAAQVRWASRGVKHRISVIKSLRALMARHAVELAASSAEARARNPSESLTAEVLPLIEAARFLERTLEKTLAPRPYGNRLRPFWLRGTDFEIRREPLGVVLVIGPGNYPLLLPGVQMLQAVAAGNAVMVKPGENGTGAVETLRALMLRAGMEAGLVSILSESTAAARAAITSQPDKVLFTGSSARGRAILGQLAVHGIPSAMELSGCDAAIVMPDADLDLAVSALVFGLFLNAGRTCLAPRRVFVHDAVAGALESELIRALQLRMAQESFHACHLGGVVRRLLREAIDDGARFVAGSEANFPIILAGVSPSARILQADIFDPIMCIVPVPDESAAVHFANNCDYALGASVFTRSESAGRRMAAQLNAGFVSVNDVIIPTADPRMPFGGRAGSGFGVTRGTEGLLELTAHKIVSVTRAKFRPAFLAPQPGDLPLIQAYIALAHGLGFRERWQACKALVRAARRWKKIS